MAKYPIHHYPPNIYVRLHIACHNTLDTTKKKSNILPFGRINIMFMGDFLQFFPINDTPLYSTNIQLIFTFTN
jgi:hypothetical protein